MIFISIASLWWTKLRLGTVFVQYRKMCVSFAEPYTTDSFFARTPVEFVVLFLRYQNLEKVFAFPVAVSICF